MKKPTFRSSEMDRVLTCNGSITVVPLVAPRDSDEGFPGVMGHWMIADRAIRELGATPSEGGLPPPDVPAGYKLPANDLWIVEFCLRHIRETIPADWSLLVETPLSYEYERWINSGHIDLLAISPCGTKSRGIDWKFVRNPVDPAESNEQVGSYLALEKRAWPDLTEATFQICQPRVSEEDGVERISTVTVTNLDALVETLDRRVCEALDNSRELNSGNKQCAFCPVGCQCKALQLENELMKTTLTDADIARVKREPDDETLVDWVMSARTLKRPTEDATELLHKRLDERPFLTAGDGTTVTRQIQKGSYTIDKPLEFFQAAKEMLADDARMAKVFKPSMTRLTDEVAEVLNIPRGGKSAITAQGVVDAKFKPFVTQGEKRLLQFS